VRNAADFESRRVQPLVASCRLAAATLHAARVPPPRLAPGAAARLSRPARTSPEEVKSAPPGSPIGSESAPGTCVLLRSPRRAGPGRTPLTGRAGALCADDDPRDAVFGYPRAAIMMSPALSLKQRITSDDTREPKLIRSFAVERRRPTTGDRASSSSRFAIVSACRSAVVRSRPAARPAVSGASGSRASRGATSPCGTLFFVERSLTCLR
jgi:hypothetical protein